MNDRANRPVSPRREPETKADHWLEKLRQTKKIAHNDLPILAQNLGKLATELDPKHPESFARQWVEQANTSSDAWAKRKRRILFPSETPHDPREHGAYITKSHEWAALLDAAGKSAHTGDHDTTANDRRQCHRRLLYGTSYVSAGTPLLPSDRTAQDLLITLANKITAQTEERTGLMRLWDVLRTTPFAPVDLSQPRARFPGFLRKHKDDPYFHGPLGEVAKRAQALPAHLACDDALLRFKPGGSSTWAYPRLDLGYLAHKQNTRQFVLAENFWDALPYGWDDVEERDDLGEWEGPLKGSVYYALKAKGLINGCGDMLPEIDYDPELGYGWRNISVKRVKRYSLILRPKPDGHPGLWIKAVSDYKAQNCIFPALDSLDCLDEEIKRGNGQVISEIFIPHGDYGATFSEEEECWLLYRAIDYSFLPWPKNDNVYSSLPNAFDGLFELESIPFDEVPAGWIDNLDDQQLQSFLFSTGQDESFLPFFPVIPDMPLPCGANTPAAALFANSQCDEGERLIDILLQQAEAIASAGLAFYDALMVDWQRRISEL